MDTRWKFIKAFERKDAPCKCIRISELNLNKFESIHTFWNLHTTLMISRFQNVLLLGVFSFTHEKWESISGKKHTMGDFIPLNIRSYSLFALNCFLNMICEFLFQDAFIERNTKTRKSHFGTYSTQSSWNGRH